MLSDLQREMLKTLVESESPVNLVMRFNAFWGINKDAFDDYTELSGFGYIENQVGGDIITDSGRRALEQS